MFDRYRDEHRFDSKEALSLARKLGREIAESNRAFFRMISHQLFNGYAAAMAQPISNEWRRLSGIVELRTAAEEAYEKALGRDDPKGKADIAHLFSESMRTLHANAMPRLLMLFKDEKLDLDLMKDIATELMQLRHEAVVATSRIKKGVVFGFTNYMADRRAEALHERYLAELSNGDICHALSIVANKVRKLASNADSEYAKDELFERAAHLAKTARMFGGSQKPETWKSLSETETYAEDHFASKRYRHISLAGAA